MKLNVNFERLEQVLKSMGGEKAKIGVLRAIPPRSGPSIDRVLEGPGSLDDVVPTGGVLGIGKSQITLHIFEPHDQDRDSLSQIPAPNPKFHVAECKTIETMREKGRFDRYVATNRRDGYFRVRPLVDHMTRLRGDEMEAKLSPCKNCLYAIDYDSYTQKSYSKRREIVDDFDLDQFFQNFESIFRSLPIYSPERFPHGGYTSDWAKISYAIRERKKWTCSCCDVNCSAARGLLHVHHKDGNLGNNKMWNLEVLCLACHKSRPLHESPKYHWHERQKIEQLRREQNLGPKCKICKI